MYSYQSMTDKGGENRVALKQILKKLEKDGLITKQPGGNFTAPQGLPAVGVIEITKIEIDGDVLARPVDWNTELQGEVPRIEVAPDNKHFPKISEGMRMLARFERSEEGYDAHIIRVIDSTMGRVLGVGEVAGGEGFALGETRFGRLQTLGTRGAFSREIRSGGGETGGELGAGLFEFVVRSGEAGELFIPRADPFQHCGLAVVLDQPSNDSGEQGSGEGDESKNHVKLGGRSLVQINPGCVP